MIFSCSLNLVDGGYIWWTTENYKDNEPSHVYCRVILIRQMVTNFPLNFCNVSSLHSLKPIHCSTPKNITASDHHTLRPFLLTYGCGRNIPTQPQLTHSHILLIHTAHPLPPIPVTKYGIQVDPLYPTVAG